MHPRFESGTQPIRIQSQAYVSPMPVQPGDGKLVPKDPRSIDDVGDEQTSDVVGGVSIVALNVRGKPHFLAAPFPSESEASVIGPAHLCTPSTTITMTC